MSLGKTTLLAGIAAKNATLFHRVRFLPPDSSVIIDFPDSESVYLVRDLEMDRARKFARADKICCAADYEPDGGLSGDRDTALAQATAECIRRAGKTSIVVDRTLPYLYAHHIQQVGISIEYSENFGVMERRIKSEEEIEHLRYAQKVTGEAVTFACQTIANAMPNKEGVLKYDGSELTSERVRAMITVFLLEKNFSNHHDSIVVTLPHVADCHHFGTGALRVDQPVIVDVFPMDNERRYHGDMTRTVVNGTPTDEFLNMHRVVQQAKLAGCAALKAGVTGEFVHQAVAAVIESNGYLMLSGDARHDAPCATMRHGTGHGIGLEVHEPILLANGGGEIFRNEIFTVEPGLYSATEGGVRIEDMVLATEQGHEVLSPLYEGLDWRD